jgi:putative oxidoreductase
MKRDMLLIPPGKRRLLFWARLVLGGLFLYAGISKISQPYQFAASIQAYQLLPELLVGLAAVLIPWIETVGAFALFWGRTTRGALLTFMILLAVFAVVIVITLFRGLDIDCGCGLLNNRRVGWLVLAEDFALLLVTAWLYYSLLPRPVAAPAAQIRDWG